MILPTTKEIKEFFKKHPYIDCPPSYKKRYTNRGCFGDQAGTPEPAIQVYRDLLFEKQELFTQEEFVEYVKRRWADFLKSLPSQDHVVGCLAKCFWNFYSGATDELYVEALLIESGKFDEVSYNPEYDTEKGIDLTCWRNNIEYHIGLFVDSPHARKNWERKRQRNPDVIYVPLSLDRPLIGNRRWYTLEDFKELFQRVEENEKDLYNEGRILEGSSERDLVVERSLYRPRNLSEVRRPMERSS